MYFILLRALIIKTSYTYLPPHQCNSYGWGVQQPVHLATNDQVICNSHGIYAGLNNIPGNVQQHPQVSYLPKKTTTTYETTIPPKSFRIMIERPPKQGEEARGMEKEEYIIQDGTSVVIMGNETEKESQNSECPNQGNGDQNGEQSINDQISEAKDLYNKALEQQCKIDENNPPEPQNGSNGCHPTSCNGNDGSKSEYYEPQQPTNYPANGCGYPNANPNDPSNGQAYDCYSYYKKTMHPQDLRPYPIPATAEAESTSNPQEISAISQPAVRVPHSEYDSHSANEAPLQILPAQPPVYQDIPMLRYPTQQEYQAQVLQQQAAQEEAQRKAQQAHLCKENTKKIHDLKEQFTDATKELNEAIKDAGENCKVDGKSCAQEE